jgi:hypothetical protein
VVSQPEDKRPALEGYGSGAGLVWGWTMAMCESLSAPSRSQLREVVGQWRASRDDTWPW